jgi:7-cyano-7-deazaguanine synthase
MSAEPEIVLLSGGMDSAALAYWRTPAITLFIDYGQRPRDAEQRAAAAIAAELDLRHAAITVDASRLGMGLLSGDEDSGGPSPEWWPYRNQMLTTLAAAWAVKTGHTGHRLVLGTVAGDGARHLDGTANFYRTLDALLQAQEGDMRVHAPAIEMEAIQLIRDSGVPPSVLAWSHSCHRADIPCLDCPGCFKHAQIREQLGTT